MSSFIRSAANTLTGTPTEGEIIYPQGRISPSQQQQQQQQQQGPPDQEPQKHQYFPNDPSGPQAPYRPSDAPDYSDEMSQGFAGHGGRRGLGRDGSEFIGGLEAGYCGASARDVIGGAGIVGAGAGAGARGGRYPGEFPASSPPEPSPYPNPDLYSVGATDQPIPPTTGRNAVDYATAHLSLAPTHPQSGLISDIFSTALGYVKAPDTYHPWSSALRQQDPFTPPTPTRHYNPADSIAHSAAKSALKHLLSTYTVANAGDVPLTSTSARVPGDIEEKLLGLAMAEAVREFEGRREVGVVDIHTTSLQDTVIQTALRAARMWEFGGMQDGSLGGTKDELGLLGRVGRLAGLLGPGQDVY